MLIGNYIVLRSYKLRTGKLKTLVRPVKYWAKLLPFAPVRARCTPYTEVHKTEITNHSFLKSLQALPRIQRASYQMV